MSRHHRHGGQAKGRQWEVLRSEALRSQGRRCSACGKAGRLEVHHVRPLSEGGSNDAENLAVLCRDCHIQAHRPALGDRERAWQEFVGELR